MSPERSIQRLSISTGNAPASRSDRRLWIHIWHDEVTYRSQLRMCNHIMGLIFTERTKREYPNTRVEPSFGINYRTATFQGHNAFGVPWLEWAHQSVETSPSTPASTTRNITELDRTANLSGLWHSNCQFVLRSKFQVHCNPWTSQRCNFFKSYN